MYYCIVPLRKKGMFVRGWWCCIKTKIECYTVRQSWLLVRTGGGVCAPLEQVNAFPKVNLMAFSPVQYIDYAVAACT